MQRAGADRRAHLRWAEQYNKSGDVHKAIAHLGRALYYDTTRSSRFAGDHGARFRYEHRPTFGGQVTHVTYTGDETYEQKLLKDEAIAALRDLERRAQISLSRPGATVVKRAKEDLVFLLLSRYLPTWDRTQTFEHNGITFTKSVNLGARIQETHLTATKNGTTVRIYSEYDGEKFMYLS
jgi:hypothetical protein